MSYGGTSRVERIIRSHTNSITIGIGDDVDLGTSDVRLFIDDADDYINSKLSSTIDSLPVTPTPGGLRFASNYFTAYLIHSSLFSANKPKGVSPAVMSWKEMAEDAINNYKENHLTAGSETRHTSQTKVFTDRGVSGVSYQGAKGLLEDDDDVRDNTG